MAALGAPDNGNGGPSPPPQSRATGRTERVLAVLYGCPAFTFYGRQYTAYTTHTQCGYPVWAGVGDDRQLIFYTNGRWYRNFGQGDFAKASHPPSVLPPASTGWRFCDTPDETDDIGCLPAGARVVHQPGYAATFDRLQSLWSTARHSAMTHCARHTVLTVMLSNQRLGILANMAHVASSGTFTAATDAGDILLGLLEGVAGTPVPPLPIEMWRFVFGFLCEAELLPDRPLPAAHDDVLGVRDLLAALEVAD